MRRALPVLVTFCLGLTAAASSADLRLIDAVQNRDHHAIAALMNEPVNVNASQPGVSQRSCQPTFGDRLSIAST